MVCTRLMNEKTPAETVIKEINNNNNNTIMKNTTPLFLKLKTVEFLRNKLSLQLFTKEKTIQFETTTTGLFKVL